MTSATTEPQKPAFAMGRVAWAAWFVVVLAAVTRALVNIETMPGWSIDPLRMVAPTTGVTPMQLLSLDLLTLAASGVLLFACAAGGVSMVLLVLGALGLVPAAWHGLAGPAGLDIESLQLGAAWAAAVVGAIALAHAARHERCARLSAAVLVGVIGVLALKGGMQVFLEHRETVRQFQASREAFLASQGLQPGSAGAAAFERRLMQPEATGWFGLSNVFATFAAGAMAMLAGWAVLSRRRVDDPIDRPSEGWSGMLFIAALVAAAALWFSHSKGGIGAGLIGLVLAIAALALNRIDRPRLARLSGFAGVGLVVGTIAAVAARGIVGERLGELSLLFRWFYWQGAARIFADAPLVGVGPAGFKDAYAVAKPALSPEEVASPHSVMIDFAATLGLGGLAWAGAFLVLIYAAGRAMLSRGNAAMVTTHASTIADGASRTDARVVIGMATLALVASSFVERYALVPEALAARVIGLALWALMGLAVLSLLRSKVGATSGRAVIAAAALAMAVHAQIELTGTWPTSASLFFAVLGLAAAPAISGRSHGMARVIAGGVVAAAIAAGVVALPRLARWEGALDAAAREANPLGEIWRRIDFVQAGNGRGENGEGMAQIATSVGDALGEFPANSNAGFNQQLARLTARTAEAAARRLAVAVDAAPSHHRTREAATRVWLARSAALVQSGEPVSSAGVAEAFANAAALADAAGDDGGGLNLRASVALARYQATNDPAFLAAALDEWTAAAKLDPHNWTIPLRAMGAAATLGRSEEAKAWAKKSLEADALQRLDPLRQLRPADRAVIDRVLNEPAPERPRSDQAPNKP